MSHAKRRMDREVEREKWGWRGGRFEENSGWEAK
jgi:hypothetical protein